MKNLKVKESNNEENSSNNYIPQRMDNTGSAIVALAASAGGLKAISIVLSALPQDFPAAIVIVQHLAPKHNSLMASILARRVALKVKEAQEGDNLFSGTVYIAPPDHHLVVNDNSTLSLTQSELVNFVRPSADLLFESVAKSYQQKAIAVVLTGTGHDGMEGVRAIHHRGGLIIVQDQETSEFFGMPRSAIETGVVNFVLPLSEIAPTLISLSIR